jgi:beta-fructofuranosidase
MSDNINTINKKHQEAINKANKEIERKKDVVKNGLYRLKYHFMAPTGWINDPNGLVQFKGEYQLFYQHYPYDSKWGPMHWGHAKSKDLVHWEHLPVALAPSEPYDSGEVSGYGCFSGSAVVDGEQLVLIYTGHVDHKEPMQVQCIATSENGTQFEKYSQNPVIKQYPEDGSPDFRDPKVWKHNGNWYMVVGSKKDGKGKALLYVSTNLKIWKYVGVVAESDGAQGDMWECPDLFPLQGKNVLIVSPMYGKQNEQPFYVIGEMDYDNGVFTQQISRTLDYGFDFYAPQTFLDDKGRRIMIGWMEKWLTKMPSQEHGWAGAMTIPRELVLDDDRIVKQKPVTEIETLRTREKRYDSFTVENLIIINEITDESAEVIIDFELRSATASEFGIQLRCSEDANESTVITINTANMEVSMDRENSGVGEKGVSKAPFRMKEDGTVQLRIFMDTSSVEVFINDGEQVITNRIFPDKTSRLFKLFSNDGIVNVAQMKTWTLKSVWE